jgi:hypothetical protein
MDTQNTPASAHDANAIVWKDKKHFMWFPAGFTTYYIKNDRLMIKRGLLSTTLDETLLYRIVDLTCKQTLGGRLFGTGHVILKTRVDTMPEIVLENISKPFQVRDMLSNLIEESRRRQNVVGNEFYGGNGPHKHMDGDGDGFCDIDGAPKN